MDKDFCIEKLKVVTDEQLQNILQLENDSNKEMMDLVRKEAVRRNLMLTPLTQKHSSNLKKIKKNEDIKWAERLNDFLWGLHNID
jgi:hypothetical protein